MSAFIENFQRGFGKLRTKEELRNIFIRAAVGILPLILYVAFSAKNFKHVLGIGSTHGAKAFRYASIATALIFLLVLTINTILDQSRPAPRSSSDRLKHRLGWLIIFSGGILVFKITILVIFAGTAIFILPDLLSIVLFGLMLFLCNMKQG